MEKLIIIAVYIYIPVVEYIKSLKWHVKFVPSEKWLWLELVALCISYLVAAVGLQSVWSLSLAIADIYCLSVRRSFRHVGVISLFAIGDGVRKTCLTRQLKFSDAMLFLKGRDAAMYLWKRCDQYLCENATLLDYFPTRN